jgi:hypothetical protein
MKVTWTTIKGPWTWVALICIAFYIMCLYLMWKFQDEDVMVGVKEPCQIHYIQGRSVTVRDGLGVYHDGIFHCVVGTRRLG